MGVFVNEAPENIAAIVNDGMLDLVQLHGDEDGAYIQWLRQLVDVPLIKAVRVQTREQILEAEQLPCDYLLLDTFMKNAYGGSGKTFNLGLIPALSKPFFPGRRVKQGQCGGGHCGRPSLVRGYQQRRGDRRIQGIRKKSED